MGREETGLGRAESSRDVLPSRVLGAGDVLNRVRRGQANTTSQLASGMGLARSTVTDRVSLLIEHGLLTTEVGSLTGERGRPAAILRFNPAAGIALAVHLGLSGARLAITDLNGDILASEQVDLDLRTGPRSVLNAVAERLAEMVDAAGSARARVHGLGVGLPGAIDLETQPQGTQEAPGSWDVAAVRGELGNLTGVPVFVDRDVSMLAFGEHHARGFSSETLLCVKAGTVYGCGIVINGAIVGGAGALAGEIGHTRVGDETVPCVCGNRGCLNAVSGGAVIARRLADDGLDAPNARAVAELTNAGDIAAGQAIRQAGRDLGVVLSSAINLLNPATISIWGYLAEAGEHLFAGISESISMCAAPGAARAVRIERTLLGEDAGIYGAAMVVVGHALAPANVDDYLALRVRASSSSSTTSPSEV